MDFQDWLIVIGVLIILGILIDGYRRMRRERINSLQMSKNMGGDIETSPLDDDYNPELPGGGARVVGREEPSIGFGSESDIQLDDGPSLGGQESPLTSQAQSSSEEQASIDNVGIAAEPSLPLDAKIGDFESSAAVATGVDSNAMTAKNLNALDQDAVAQDAVPGERLVADEPLVAELDERPQSVSSTSVKRDDTKRSSAKRDNAKVVRASASAEASVSSSNAGDQEVIVINVDAKPGMVFHGLQIKQLLEACGMTHGDMSIFHRHEEDDLLSPVQFSVANAVEPGYFDPAQMASLSTPGVSFFMSMPGPKDYMKAFEFMLETAQCFANNLQGELKDERRSVLTKQTIEHCKQRVREFERKQLSRAKA